MVSFNLLLIMNALDICILTDSKIQQTGYILAAMDMSDTVTNSHRTFSKSYNTHSRLHQPDEHRGTGSQTTIGEGYRHLPLTRFS